MSMKDAVGSLDALQATDPDVYAAIDAEEERQRDKLLLIASENFASPAVLAAQGSLMTNKYAEGYPGKTVLRRLSACGHSRRPRHPTVQADFRRGACECSTALRFASQHGRLPVGAQARRHDPRDGPGPGRSPDPWQQSQFFRNDFSCVLVWVDRQTGNHRLMTRSASWPKNAALA